MNKYLDEYNAKYKKKGVSYEEYYSCRRKPRKRSLLRKSIVIQFGHYIPFSKGGDNCEKNIQLECKSCNLKKGIGIKKAGVLNYRGVKGCTKRHERKLK